ncbi:MAG: cupin domain-containing protein [Candidatus Latescibacterota bacterium]|jgi:mannose-6-phosphate isomerase-like protein (cupin superfamily)
MRLALLDPLWCPGQAVPLFPDQVRTTPWSAYEALELKPGQEYRGPSGQAVEVGLVLLTGALTATDLPEPIALLAPAVALCPAVDRPLLLANPGTEPTRLLLACVAGATEPGPAPGLIRTQPLDRGALPWRPAIHGGIGRIASRHLWGPADCRGAWTFIDHAVLAPGSSLGYHYHDGLEESFVVLAGRGTLVGAGRTLAVGPGTVTWQAIREPHGLFGSGPEELEFLRLAVRRPGEEFTTVDLHDDLAGGLGKPEGTAR